MRIAVVTGNPRPASRTHGVALAVADTLRAALVSPARSAPKPRSTDAFSGLSVFKQVSALIGAVGGCTW